MIAVVIVPLPIACSPVTSEEVIVTAALEEISPSILNPAFNPEALTVNEWSIPIIPRAFALLSNELFALVPEIVNVAISESTVVSVPSAILKAPSVANVADWTFSKPVPPVVLIAKSPNAVICKSVAFSISNITELAVVPVLITALVAVSPLIFAPFNSPVALTVI